jgi:hypothetical protein
MWRQVEQVCIGDRFTQDIPKRLGLTGIIEGIVDCWATKAKMA